MSEHAADVLDREFFTALVEAKIDTLDRILADDFVLIDVMTGSEVQKSALLDVIGGGHLTFARIERLEFRIRTFGATAVVTGRTEMNGTFGGQVFGASSRYTHVFVEADGGWYMVAAQGTQIAPSPGAA